MGFGIGEFVSMYLLFPIIAIIMAGIAGIIAKKNQLLNNKKLIFILLLSSLLLALPALLGFIDYWFMPYVYIGLQIFYFFLGWLLLDILGKQAKEISEKPYYVEFSIILIIQLVGAALFSLIFNLCNELQYGLWACTCIIPFIFPSLFRKAYKTFLYIPLEIYKIWSYTLQDETSWSDEYADSSGIIVVEMELFKQVSDNISLNIKAKAQKEMPFGLWFKVFINDYNIKSSASPIVAVDSNNSYGWIFYTLTSVLGRKRYIDPDISFVKNKIKEHRVIIAKRARYEEFNQIITD